VATWPCHDITRAATAILADDASKASLRNMAAEGAPPAAFAEFLAERCEPELSALVRAEFLEMPAGMIGLILSSWSEADRAGKSFELSSVSPAEPLQFARSRRVRLTLDYEADRAVISLSHVPGRHAGWYQPVPQAAVA